MYYNEKLKERFLSDSLNKANYKRLFLQSFKIESELGKDLGEMSKEEAIQVVNSFEYYISQSVRSLCSFVNGYRGWYNSAFEKVLIEDVDIVSPMRKNLYLSWVDVQNDLKGYDYDQGDPLAAALALTWLGFKNSDSVLFRKEQIDYQNGLIFDADHNLVWPMRLIGGLTFEIEPEILDIFTRYQNVQSAHIKRNQVEYIERADSPYFIYRMVSKNSEKDGSKPFDSAYISTKTHHQAKKSKSERLSVSNILESGKLYRFHRYKQTSPSQGNAYVMNLHQCFSNPRTNTWDAEYEYKKYKEAFNL